MFSFIYILFHLPALCSAASSKAEERCWRAGGVQLYITLPAGPAAGTIEAASENAAGLLCGCGPLSLHKSPPTYSTADLSYILQQSAVKAHREHRGD